MRPEPYRGPVPLVTHVHGAHTTEDSDGYPEAWYLPDASDIPPGYGRVGSVYEEYRTAFKSRTGADWAPGSSTFEYPNDQAASTLWYHDHTLGMTRLNVYAGPAGFYLLRGGPSDQVVGTLPGPAPAPGDPPGTRYYEIPLAIQDRSFNADGSLFYPDSRMFFDGFSGPYVPDSDISPLWNPEFFADSMLVNGRTWPFLEVERRRYRFRLLNGCNSRFLILRMTHGATFWQIGSEQGFLPAPVQVEELLLAPAERADPVTENPAVGDTEVWEIYNFTMDAHPIHIHQVAFEVVDREPGGFGEMDGGMGGMGGMVGMGTSRRLAAAEGGPRPPEPNETGLKDTVIAYPGEITRVKATFDLPGRFVWHCHIVEHEDNEMMRPFRVGP